MMDVFSAAVTLFLTMDPLGNVPIFIAVLKKLDPKKRRRVLVRELFFSLAILVGFLLIGEYILRFLNLRQETISIAGGIVLFLIALRMIFPPHEGILGDIPDGEPFIVPLAIPLVAGPSALATILLLARSEPGRLAEWLLAVLVAWIVSAAILLFSGVFYRVFRQRGLIAMERLMGMILVMVSVQMFLDGVAGYMRR
ncbi:MAG: YhgN family NAAT transporter [Candidatus Eisenbacteria bacterium]|nr:YhgN family NAAT transporter [Candidatus Eisenbacteria bacterium]